MTLIVSLRIPDGIVIAGDSLATMMGNLQPHFQFEVECPNCHQKHTLEGDLPSIALPSTTYPYAQKVFPFIQKYGIGTYGAGQLIGKTILFAVREFEQSYLNEKPPDGVSKIAEVLGKYLHKLLVKQVIAEGKKIEDMPDNWKAPLGIQVVGYDQQEAKTVEVSVGKEVVYTPYTGIGVTVSGASQMVQMLFDMNKKNPQEAPIYEAFTLQDAIGYAEFLISTTASQQQFSRTIPKVGGHIDIALVTPFDNFTWIRQKSLT